MTVVELRPGPWNDRSAAIDSLLYPRSIVLIGASEKSRWSSALLDNLRTHGFAGPVNLVNRRGSVVAGQPSARSCAELSEQADLGVVMVPAAAVPDAVAGLADVGARSAVVLTSGFAETGTKGAVLQRKVVKAATDAGVTLLGPNSLGFINLTANIVAWATPIDLPSRSGGVALISQSGATAFFLTTLAHQQDVPLSHVVATGNEAALSGSDVVRHLVEDSNVRAIAMFLESVREPASFLDAAQAADAAGVPMVVLKVGSSEVSARSALAHTGAVVGDDGVFDGICERYGILRVRSMEDLLTTADVIARTGRMNPGGLCVVSNSGGVCEIAADSADALGIDLPEIPADTALRLREALPDFGTPHNPLDLTGGIEPEQAGDAIAALAGSGPFSVALVPFYPIPNSTQELPDRQKALYLQLSRGLREAGVPGFLVSYTAGGLSADGRALVAELDIPYLACGLDRALNGLAGALRWSRRQPRPFGEHNAITEPIPTEDHPRSERETMDLLCRAGVPTIRQDLVSDRDSAVAAARAIGGPVVLKIASPDIGHKTDIGGVALRIEGDAQVAAAFDSVLAAGQRQQGARLDGVLISPMRENGKELFVGCTVDPVWGPVLAVGLGGVFVEVFADVAIRPLPVTPAEVTQMLQSLRGARLLTGERGTVAVNLDAVSRAVAAIGDLALRLGPNLDALDINPLWVEGDHVEALDGLVVWRDRPEPTSAAPVRS